MLCPSLGLASFRKGVVLQQIGAFTEANSIPALTTTEYPERIFE